jgi:putative mycofactocin binding protein MftB
MTAVLDRALAVAPQVSVRPEPFGALLYHFGSRRLSFLKDPRLLSIIEGLADAPTARAACAAAGVDAGALAPFERALERLVAGGMLEVRDS